MKWGSLLEKVRAALQSQVCWQCFEKAVPVGVLFCKRCQDWLAIRAPGPLPEITDFTCHAATIFSPPVKKLLYGYKFYQEEQFAPRLASVLIHYWNQLLPTDPLRTAHPESFVVVPIPPRPGQGSRLNSYAGRFARHFGYDFQPDCLHWARNVVPQHTLHHRKDRQDNIAYSLAVHPGVLKGHQRMLVIDDLVTTGCTLREALRALLEAGGPASTCDITALALTRVPLRLPE